MPKPRTPPIAKQIAHAIACAHAASSADDPARARTWVGLAADLKKLEVAAEAGAARDEAALGAALFDLAARFAWMLLHAPDTMPAAFEAEVAAWRAANLQDRDPAPARAVAASALRRYLEIDAAAAALGEG